MCYDDCLPTSGPVRYRSSALTAVVNALVENPKLRSISSYESPDLVVTATRRGKPDKRQRHLEMVLTIGRPNYRGRQFVRACLKAGEPFPVRKVQLKWMKGARP